MQWLVDGMNLLGSRPDGWWRDRPAARRRLVGELADFARRPDIGTVAVVFDGRPQAGEEDEGRAAGIDVAFAPGGPNAADRVIAARARGCATPGNLTVVTSDGALAGEVAGVGVVVIGVAAFRRLLDASPI